MTMKMLPPMSPQHFEALVKLVNAGARAAGLQAHVEIGLAGAVLNAVQDIPDPEEPKDASTPASAPGKRSRAPQRKRKG